MLGRLINKNASWFFLAAVLIGGFFPRLAALFYPYLGYILMVVLLLGFLTVDSQVLKLELKAWHYQLYLLVLTLIIIPACAYFIALLLGYACHLPQDFAVSVLIVFAAPTALAAPTVCMLFGGNIERAQIVAILATILVIFSLPLLCGLLLRDATNIQAFKLIPYIGFVIVVPLVIAVIFRKIAAKLITKYRAAIPAFSVIFITLLIFAGTRDLHKMFLRSPKQAIIALLLMLLIFVLVFALGWILAFRKDYKSKLTSAIVSTWCSIGVAILLVHIFFQHSHPLTMLYVVTGAVAWNISLIAAKSAFR